MSKNYNQTQRFNYHENIKANDKKDKMKMLKTTV